MRGSTGAWRIRCGVWLLPPAIGLAIWGTRFGVKLTAAISLWAIVWTLLVHRRWRRGQQLLVALTAVFAVLVLMAQVAIWRPVVTFRQPPTAPVALILGAGLKADGRLSDVLQYRLDEGVRWLAAHPAASVLVSGGQGEDEPEAEAAAMARYLMAHGVAAPRIWQENRSHDTRENLQFSRQILQAQFPGQPVVLITSNFHLYRAQREAQRVGLQVAGLPAPTPWTALPVYTLREGLAVWRDWLF